MHLSTLLGSLALVSCLPETLAHPGSGWKAKIAEIQERAARPARGNDDSSELLGDLVRPGPRTEVGRLIADLLVGRRDAQSNEINRRAAGPLGSRECGRDTCCVWTYLVNEMEAKFRTPSGRCNKFARGAVRLAFHDAGTWKKGLDFGGADGSLLLSDEMSRPENRGLEEIAEVTNRWYDKYKQYGVTMADIIQMEGTVATVVCPLGPRIRSFVGRKDSARAATDGLMPGADDDADFLIRLFEDKTIRPHGLAALVGAHTTSQQRFFRPERALDPQDSTPGVWDVLFYPQTLDPNAPRRVFKFPSDVSLSRHPRIADEWREFADPRNGQEHWNDDFAKEMIRLGLLGVNNINDLVDCTRVLPPFTGRTFRAFDQTNVDLWANGGFQSRGQQIGQMLEDGVNVDNGTLASVGIDPKLVLQGLGLTPPDNVGRSPIIPASILPPILKGWFRRAAKNTRFEDMV